MKKKLSGKKEMKNFTTYGGLSSETIKKIWASTNKGTADITTTSPIITGTGWTFAYNEYNEEKRQDSQHDKGVCQDSYDKGYEDGLKAAKEAK